MRAFAELAAAIPRDLTEEFVKRLAYVSQEIRNPDLLPGARRVAFDVQPGFEERTDQVVTSIREVAEKLCLELPFLQKPYDFDDVAARIAAFTRKAA